VSVTGREGLAALHSRPSKSPSGSPLILATMAREHWRWPQYSFLFRGAGVTVTPITCEQITKQTREIGGESEPSRAVARAARPTPTLVLTSTPACSVSRQETTHENERIGITSNERAELSFAGYQRVDSERHMREAARDIAIVMGSRGVNENIRTQCETCGLHLRHSKTSRIGHARQSVGCTPFARGKCRGISRRRARNWIQPVQRH
jgi:hypothetical protein